MGSDEILLGLFDHRGQLVTLLVWAVVLAFAAVYVLEELRGSRKEKRDALLGAKVLLCLLMSLGLQFFLGGLAVGLANVLGPGHEELTQLGFGICAGGALTFLLPGLLYWFLIRPRTEPDIFHKALGINGAISGTVSGLTVTATVLAIIRDLPATSPGVFAAIYTVALLSCSLPLLLPQTRLSDNENEKDAPEEEPAYSSLNPPD